jgi:hypothetical protein
MGLAPTVEMVCCLAYEDMGLEVLRSVHDGDRLLLAYWHAHEEEIL